MSDVKLVKIKLNLKLLKSKDIFVLVKLQSAEFKQMFGIIIPHLENQYWIYTEHLLINMIDHSKENAFKNEPI